ncbi:hypothetical protein DERF_012960 [Dermatophagoides farinae]|uniref:Uncharacterized protein n=1 Tax=Dermatophagoides farinae TaxID=6954 RepID=A0A922HQ99_DERFA|nr:hypothetical protein DERF_012960 [Dermatophagoides farinae]
MNNSTNLRGEESISILQTSTNDASIATTVTATATNEETFIPWALIVVVN